MPRGKSKKISGELSDLEGSDSFDDVPALEGVDEKVKPLTLDVGNVELLESEFDPVNLSLYKYDIKGVVFRNGLKYICLEVLGENNDYN